MKTGPEVPWSVPADALAATRRPNSEYTMTTTFSPKLLLVISCGNGVSASSRDFSSDRCAARSSAWVSKSLSDTMLYVRRHAGLDARRHQLQIACQCLRVAAARRLSAWRSSLDHLSEYRGRLGVRTVGLAHRGHRPRVVRIDVTERVQRLGDIVGHRRDPVGKRCGNVPFPNAQGGQHRSDVDPPQRIVASGVEPAADPTCPHGLVGRRGLPDIHRPEVAAVLLRIPNNAHDGQLIVDPKA